MNRHRQQVTQRQDAILEQMGKFRTMFRGTVSEQQYAQRRARKEGEGATGPYFVWQGSIDGKHFSRRVSGQRAQQLREGIQARHRFEQLCAQYIELGEAHAALALEGEPSNALKKTPKSPSKPTRK
jgi:hypothetical protein